jgi:hypothetical protein
MKMKIDTSIPKNSLLIDVPYRYAYRHLEIAAGAPHLSLSKRISHLFQATIHSIPIINIFSSVAEHSYQKVIHIQGETYFKRGVSFGKQMRSRIQNLYPLVLQQIYQDSEFLKEKAALIKNIPTEIYEELEGLAKGAKVSLDDVLTVHLFLDLNPGRFGCSVVASSKKGKVVATNHFKGDRYPSPNSLERESILKKCQIKSLSEKKEALLRVNENTTIQSMILNPSNGTIHLSAGSGHSAKNQFVKYQVFAKKPNAESSSTISRNLDWPWLMLGPETIITVYDSPIGKVANVTFPGYIGSLSGMNEHGVSLACSTAGSFKQPGIPITLLFKKILEAAKTTQEAKKVIESSTPASSMNITIAGNDALARVEINSKVKLPAKQATFTQKIHSFFRKLSFQPV